MNIQKILDELVTVGEAAEIMGVTRGYVNLRIHKKQIEAYTVGNGARKIYLIPRKAAEQYERER